VAHIPIPILVFRRRQRLPALLILIGLLLSWSANSLADTVTVKLSGIEDELRANARAFLTIVSKTSKRQMGVLERLKASDEEKTLAKSKVKRPNASQIARWHRSAASEIAQSLQPFGYYNPAIDGELLSPKAGEWVASYKIAPGARSQWRQITIDLSGEGETDRFVKALLQHSLVRSGDAVDHRVYDQHKRTWITRLFDEGYLDARFQEAFFRVDPATNSVDVTWSLATGPRYRFGEVEIDQDILKTSLVDRYHDIRPGEVFDTRRLIDLQLKLNGSNYFDSVSLDIQKDRSTDARVPVVVKTTPRKPRRYDLGVGFGTDTGPRVTAGLESRRVNKRGHRYRLNGRASDIESELQFEYDIPIKDVAKDRWRFYAQVQQADVGDADTTQFSLGTAHEDTWLGMRRRLYLNAEHTSFAFGDESTRSATLVYPGITLSFDRLDDPLFVRRGYSLAATLLGGADAVGSATDFVSLQLSGRGILPLGKRGRLLLASDARIVEATDFSALPPSQRFFLGGDRSVRGYRFQSISPQNAAGDDIGGPRSLSVSVEADYQVAGSWGIAAFFDAGDVSNGTPTDFKKSVGLGLRYRSPVGMIRIDLAHPLDDPDTSVRLHLSIGPDL
jgi:translocation and assembly module TamA